MRQKRPERPDGGKPRHGRGRGQGAQAHQHPQGHRHSPSKPHAKAGASASRARDTETKADDGAVDGPDAAGGAGTPDGRPPVGCRLRLTIADMALDGDAIARHDSYVLFIPGAIPGEEVEAEVVATGRKFGRARIISILKPSPHRVAPPCPHFGPCGGCTWQQHPDSHLRVRRPELGRWPPSSRGPPSSWEAGRFSASVN